MVVDQGVWQRHKSMGRMQLGLVGLDAGLLMMVVIAGRFLYGSISISFSMVHGEVIGKCVVLGLPYNISKIPCVYVWWREGQYWWLAGCLHADADWQYCAAASGAFSHGLVECNHFVRCLMGHFLLGRRLWYVYVPRDGWAMPMIMSIGCWCRCGFCCGLMLWLLVQGGWSAHSFSSFLVISNWDILLLVVPLSGGIYRGRCWSIGVDVGENACLSVAMVSTPLCRR